jgi:hypothetical protein
MRRRREGTNWPRSLRSGDDPLANYAFESSQGSPDPSRIPAMLRKTPASDFIYALFEREALDILMDPSETEELFDRTDMLITLESAHLRLKRRNRTLVLGPRRTVYLEGARSLKEAGPI